MTRVNLLTYTGHTLLPGGKRIQRGRCACGKEFEAVSTGLAKHARFNLYTMWKTHCRREHPVESRDV